MAATGEHFGAYTCVRRLGSGGMGETWLAVLRRDGGFEQRVCLKFIHEQFRRSPEAASLFMREAAIAASLRHSNIVGVIDANPELGYIALELVDGTDLRTVLRESPNQRLLPSHSTAIAIELCKALQYAHTRTRGGQFAGIVHRDISPANVLLSYAGEVKLTDFGIAKAIRATGDVGSSVKGKLSYMSPEQLTGAPLSAKSDLFSLGILLYELLAGRRPFDGRADGETVQRIVTGTFDPLSQVAPDAPAGLTALIERLLKTRPIERPASAAAVIEALGNFSPPATVCFELGELAKRSQAPTTLGSDSDLDALSLQGDLSLPEAATQIGQGPTRTRPLRPTPIPAFLADLEIAAGNTQPLAADTDPDEAADSAAHGPLASLRPSTPAGVATRSRWLATASVAFVIALGVGYVRAYQRKQAHPDPLTIGAPAAEVRAAPADTTRAPTPTRAEPPAIAPSADAKPNTKHTLEAPDASAQAVHAAQSAGNTDTVGATTAAANDTNADTMTSRAATNPRLIGAKAAAHKGTIKVGVFPSGNVWIDGRKRGRAPLTILVPSGHHEIAAGGDKPAERRMIDVGPDATEQVVFDLQATGESGGR